MDFTLTAEQRSLAETARTYLAASGTRQVAELGWLDAELSPVDLAVLAEETGFALYPGPWWSTVALAGPALRAAGRPVRRPATLAWLDERARSLRDSAVAVGCTAHRHDGGWRLTGDKDAVPDAGSVELAVVVARTEAGPGLFLADLGAHPQVVQECSTQDRTRPLARLRFADTPVQRLLEPAATGAVLHDTWRLALTLLSAEAVGVARWALRTAVAHAGSREQFGRPIGVYQAISHRLADGWTAIELAHSLTLRAAWTLAESPDGTDETDEAVCAASVAGRDAALTVCESALQVLGGIGFTWEHPLHRWYKRALWINGFDGPPRRLRAQLAATLLG